MVRIRSEHAIGFLKGRFHSLKNLCVNITDKKSHILATYWVAACIGIHSFAMQHEEKEWQQDNSDSDLSTPEDPFVAEGLSSDPELSDVNTTIPPRINTPATRLRAGKGHHERLKTWLFRAKINQASWNARSRAERYRVEDSDMDSDSDME